jgi:hypothetical protein
VELRLSPKIVEAIESKSLRSDWGALARRVEAAEGHWQMVAMTPEVRRGIAAECKERLRRQGCRAEVVGLVGLGAHPRPWTGIVVFARAGIGNEQEQRAKKRIAEVAARR